MFLKLFYTFFILNDMLLYGTHVRELIQHFLQ